jgi:hypothetical protein
MDQRGRGKEVDETSSRCESCARAIPHDAAFCIYCATPTGTAQGATTITVPRPATGATIRLRPDDAPRPTPRPHPPVVSAPRQGRTVYVTPMPHRARTVVVTPVPHPKRARKPKHNDNSFVVFIIGVLFLAATSLLWPGILALIGITQWMKHEARGKPHRALSRLVFWVGLAALTYTSFFWTGAFLLMFVSHIIGKQRRVGWA